MKKLLVLFLALVMLLGCLAACKSDPANNNNNNNSSDGEDENVPLPVANYSGKTYTVLYRTGDRYEEEWISDSSRRGDVINDAIATRNQKVTDRYKVTLDYESGKVRNDWDEFWNKVTVNYNDDTFQLIAGYTYRLADASVKGYCLNWLNAEQVPTVDLDADWWDGDFTKSAQYRGCSYIATGPLSLTDMYSSACIYFNKTLLNSFMGEKSEDPTAALFQLVEDGKWTLDTLRQYAKDCTFKDESEDDDNSIYGLASNFSTMIDAFIYASDLTMTEKKMKNGELTIVLKKVDANNRILELATKLKDFFLSSGNVTKESGDASPELVSMFVKSQAVFSTGTLSSAKEIQNYAPDISYGVLPYPKLDEAQAEYHTYKLDYKTGFCIPRSVKESNREFVGTITEALAYYSNAYVKPALYEKVLTHKLVQDKKSSASVDKILNGGLYEFANIYARAWGDTQGPAHLLRRVISDNMDFSGEYEARKTSYNTNLNNLLQSFKSDDVVSAG